MLSKDYVLGLTEGEGCFAIGIGLHEPKSRATPHKSFVKHPYIFSVKPSFHMVLVVKDMSVLEELKSAIGCGKIYIEHRSQESGNRSDAAHYYVMGVEGSLKVVDFFKDLQFRTTKGEDFMLWCNCIKLIQNKVHGTKDGIIEIARLRDCMNNTKQVSKRSPEELGELFEQKLRERREKWLSFIHNENHSIDPKTKRIWKKMLQNEDLDKYSKEMLRKAITGPEQDVLTHLA